MPDLAPVTVDRSHQIPTHVPRGATHFRLRKGGPKGVDCFHNDERGIVVSIHDIENFDKDYITGRWGFCDPRTEGGFAVAFFKRDPSDPSKHAGIGGWKVFGIIGEQAPTEEVSMVTATPVQEPTGLGNSLLLLTALSDIVDKKAEVAIRSEQIRSDSAIQSQREFMAGLFKVVESNAARMAPPPPTSTTDPNMLALLMEIRNELRGEEDPEEDEPENDFARYAGFIQAIRKGGSGAVWEFIQKEGAVAFIEAWPAIKAKLPDLIPMIAPMLNGLVSGAARGTAPSPPVAAQRAPAPVMMVAQPMNVNGGSYSPPHQAAALVAAADDSPEIS